MQAQSVWGVFFGGVGGVNLRVTAQHQGDTSAGPHVDGRFHPQNISGASQFSTGFISVLSSPTFLYSVSAPGISQHLLFLSSLLPCPV